MQTTTIITWHEAWRGWDTDYGADGGKGASGNSYCCCLGRCQVQWLLVSSVIVSFWSLANVGKTNFYTCFCPGLYLCFIFQSAAKYATVCVCVCVYVCGWCEGPIVRGCCPRLCLLPPPRRCRRVVALPRDIPGDISHKTSTQIYKFIWACSPIASCTACPLHSTPPYLLHTSQFHSYEDGGQVVPGFYTRSAHSIVRIHETGNLIF